MTERTEVEGLHVAVPLYDFLRDEALPGSGVDEATFWRALADVVERFAPRHRAALDRRAELQARIDGWHREHGVGELAGYCAFLADIGYLVPEGDDFEITTAGVDPEIAVVPGPQLVVPVTNARYALNAANARWGSLYDALYGTDALGDPPAPGPYDPERGARVVEWARSFLDEVVPLAGGGHAEVVAYTVVDGGLCARLADGSTTGLREPAAFAGYVGSEQAPSSILLRHHGLHIKLVVDRTHPVGAADPAGLADVVLEAATTAIMDCEDSVAAVDADDKVVAYRNWLGLMRGDLVEEVPKPDGTITRRLAHDRTFTAPGGGLFTLPGRALMLVRNVGLHMNTDAVLDGAGNAIPEGILDALVTVLCALHDRGRNSGTGAVYVVKPKLHGPEEVTLTDELFAAVESWLALPRDTVKIGLMDEERRTSANLRECIRAARSRIAFVNTGFLDRTGDELHTSMEAGPMVRKADMKAQPWLRAYEERNVAIALACGFRGRAQIGKGMWAAPDRMAAMLDEKIAHPRAGANCAWVPSPTAATLHATHYHRVDVLARQAELAGTPPPPLEDLLRIPVAVAPSWSPEEVAREVENNAQGILGYVVRWVDQGVGCSKVPDVDDVALMEDRATCRISSQHIANWLRHGVVDAEQVMAAMRKMAVVVDRQNAGDPAYVPMSPSFDGEAFAAACHLVLTGTEQPSGYTEPVLHARRRARKSVATRRPAPRSGGGITRQGA